MTEPRKKHGYSPDMSRIVELIAEHNAQLDVISCDEHPYYLQRLRRRFYSFRLSPLISEEIKLMAKRISMKLWRDTINSHYVLTFILTDDERGIHHDYRSLSQFPPQGRHLKPDDGQEFRFDRRLRLRRLWSRSVFRRSWTLQS